MMKAALRTGYGQPEVIQLGQVEKPIIGDQEVLVKVRASTVTAGDVRLRSLDLPAAFRIPFRLGLGIRRPRQPVPGTEFSGTIEEVGEGVTKFGVGDEVYGSTGLGIGTNAEYVNISEDGPLAKIPEGTELEEMAAVPIGAQTSLLFLRHAGVKEGDEVLIYGASGSLGTYAVQLSKYMGATVTAVCSSRNMDLVKSLGADFVVDYTKEDFTKSGKRYDVIYDTVDKSPYRASLKSLKDGGHYLLATAVRPSQMIRAGLHNMFSSKKVFIGVGTEKAEDLMFLNELILDGHLRPVIDKSYTLDEIAEAHSYVDSGRKRGNVIILTDREVAN